MPHFFEEIAKDITINKKNKETELYRFRFFGYIPDGIFCIMKKYINENVKSVIISDGEIFIDKLDDLLDSHPDIKFTICFRDPKIFRAMKKYDNTNNIKICKASIPLNLNSSYDLALSIPPFGMKGDYKAKGFSSNDSSCAFVEELLNNINSNGKVVFIAPQGITFNEQTQPFRTNILNNYKLKTVSLFPNKLFALTNIQTVLFEIENGITTDIKLNEYELKKDNSLTEIAPPIVVEKKDVEPPQCSLLIHPFSIQRSGIMDKYIRSSCKKEKLENIVKSIFRGKSCIEYKDTGNIKVINIIDVKESYIDFNNLRNMCGDERKNLIYELQDGDILLTSRGTGIRTAIFKKPDNEMYLASAGLIVIRPKDVLMAEYIQMFLSSEIGKKMLQSCTRGDTVINIAPADIKNLSIPIPTEKMLDLTKEFQKANDKVEEAKKEIEKLIVNQKQNLDKIYESFLNEILT